MDGILFAVNSHFCTTVFYTILKLLTSSKKYMLKNESIYPVCKFKENPPIFMKLR